MNVQAGTEGGQKGALDPLTLELQAVVSHSTRVLGNLGPLGEQQVLLIAYTVTSYFNTEPQHILFEDILIKQR